MLISHFILWLKAWVWVFFFTRQFVLEILQKYDIKVPKRPNKQLKKPTKQTQQKSTPANRKKPQTQPTKTTNPKETKKPQTTNIQPNKSYLKFSKHHLKYKTKTISIFSLLNCCFSPFWIPEVEYISLLNHCPGLFTSSFSCPLPIVLAAFHTKWWQQSLIFATIQCMEHLSHFPLKELDINQSIILVDLWGVGVRPTCWDGNNFGVKLSGNICKKLTFNEQIKKSSLTGEYLHAKYWRGGISFNNNGIEVFHEAIIQFELIKFKFVGLVIY